MLFPITPQNKLQNIYLSFWYMYSFPRSKATRYAVRTSTVLLINHLPSMIRSVIHAPSPCILASLPHLLHKPRPAMKTTIMPFTESSAFIGKLGALIGS